MWKYKEYFVFPNLGSLPHNGELEFVFEIVADNVKTNTTRFMDNFVEKLN